MSDATFACPDLTTFCRLEELGLEVVGQRLEPDRAVLACRVVEPDRWCRHCGCEGAPRDTVIRRLAHEPLGWRPTVLEVTVRRYRCTGCGHVWRQDTSRAAEPRAKGEALASRPAVGTGRHRVPAPHRRPGRRRPRGVVEHRQRRGPGRGQADADRRREPVRRGEGDRGRRARVAPHPPRGQVRHGDHRPHRHPRRHRPRSPAGHGRGPLQAGVQAVADRPPAGLARPSRGRRDGRLHRLQNRGCRRTARRRGRDGPLSRGAPGW